MLICQWTVDDGVRFDMKLGVTIVFANGSIVN